MKQAALPPTHRDIATSLNNLALLLQAKGRETEAEPLFRDAIEIYRAALPPDHPDLGQILLNYGRLEIALGKRAHADRLLREAREVLERKSRPGDPQLLFVTGLVASNLRELGQVTESALRFRELLATLDRVDPTRSMQWQQAYARTGLGLCLKLQQKFGEAETLFLEAEQLTPSHLPRDRLQRRQLLADYYDEWNKADPGKGHDAEAAKWRARSAETPATSPAITPDG